MHICMCWHAFVPNDNEIRCQLIVVFLTNISSKHAPQKMIKYNKNLLVLSKL